MPAAPAADHDPTVPVSMAQRAGRLAPWLLRATWVVLPFTAGTAVGDGLADASRAVQVTGTVLAWLVWAAGLLASFVPHPVGLTAVRVVTPLAVVVTAWGVLAGDTGPGAAVLALVPVLLAVVVAFWGEVGHWAVNGPAYPNERRFLLRPPGMLLLGPLPLAWALLCTGVLAGPLLLAARAWVLGSIALVVGVPLAVVLARSLQSLARRFVVFVPAGFVLHDLTSLREPVLFPRDKVEVIRAAPAGTDSLDLTQNAPGLALEVLLLEKAQITVIRRGGRESEQGGTARFLFAPTLPGRLLADAAARHIRTA